MNSLDFQFSNFQDDDFSFTRSYVVVGPTGDEYFNWQGLNDVQDDAETEFEVTLDAGGEMSDDGDAAMAFSSVEVEGEEQAEKLAEFIVAEIEETTGWSVKEATA